MSEPFDLLALGETMLSLVARSGSLSEATVFHATIGGAESNTCVALARRGLRTSWISRLGEDEPGERVRRSLTRDGVDLTWVRTDPLRPTGLMLRDTLGGVRYHRTGSAASVLEPADLDAVPVAEARAVLVTGITPMLGPGPGRAAHAFLERARGMRIVDPNLRPGLWGSGRAAELVLPLVARCDVVLGGEDELAALLGGSGRALAERCVAAGAREVVLTRGPGGAAALDRDGGWHERPAPRVHERDPVGAGDAFNAAYIHERLRDASVPEALEEGVRAGAAAASTVGDADRPDGDRSATIDEEDR